MACAMLMRAGVDAVGAQAQAGESASSDLESGPFEAIVCITRGGLVPAAGASIAAVTGDFIFVGDVGRPAVYQFRDASDLLGGQVVDRGPLGVGRVDVAALGDVGVVTDAFHAQHLRGYTPVRAPAADRAVGATEEPPRDVGLVYAIAGIGAVAGGWVAAHWGWRAAFMLASVPGICFAIVTA